MTVVIEYPAVITSVTAAATATVIYRTCSASCCERGHASAAGARPML